MMQCGFSLFYAGAGPECNCFQKRDIFLNCQYLFWCREECAYFLVPRSGRDGFTLFCVVERYSLPILSNNCSN